MYDAPKSLADRNDCAEFSNYAIDPLLAYSPRWYSLQSVVVCGQGHSARFLFTNELLGSC